MGYGHGATHTVSRVARENVWLRPFSCSTPVVRLLGFADVTDGAWRPGVCPSAAAPLGDTPDDMFNERVPLRASFRTALRNYAVPLSLFFAAAVAALVLACR
jgi:hypothetical protein